MANCIYSVFVYAECTVIFFPLTFLSLLAIRSSYKR